MNEDSKKILIADDSRFFRSLLAYAFDEEGYTCTEADTGDKVLAMVESDRPDLLILDLMMPGLNGFQVLEKLRSVEGGANLPVIVLSQYTQNALERDILARHRVTAQLTKSTAVERVLFEARGALFPSEKEARRTQRVPLTLAVTARQGAGPGILGTHLTSTFNLSESGMFLVLSDREPPEKGSEVRLKFWIPTAEKIFEIQAIVAWVNDTRGMKRSHPPGFGVDFVSPTEEVKAAIRGFIAETAELATVE